MPKTNIRENLNGNELDLSLSNLTVVPVQEIAAISKVTHLDLSNNSLVSIPPKLCTLTRLVKLDLSQNQLTSLPSNIGQLEKLKHLDLYNNQLTTLPVSMCQLKSLKWLDVKNNPLGDTLQRVTGECLEASQCQKCAKNVVAFMKKVEIEQERQRQKLLENQRAEEAAQLAREEEARRKLKEKKKMEKERRRLELEAQKEAERRAQADTRTKTPVTKESKANGKRVTKKKERVGLGCWGMFLSALLGILVLLLGVYIYCEFHKADSFCIQASVHVEHFFRAVVQLFKDITVKTNALLCQAAQHVVLWLGVAKEKLAPYCAIAFEYIVRWYIVASENCLYLYGVSKEWAVYYFELAKSKLQ